MKKLISPTILAVAILVLPLSAGTESVPFTQTPLYRYLCEAGRQKSPTYHMQLPEPQMQQPQKQSLKQPEKITDTVPDEKSYKLIFEPAPGPIRREDFRPISSLTPDTTFAEAVDIMRHLVSPPLNIVVFWKDLEANADIDRDTPIGIEALSGVTLRTHLELILTSLSATADARLTYVVHDGIIKIATEDSLPKLMGTRVYDITDLTAQPSNFFDYGGPHMFLQNRYGSGGDYGFGRNYGYGSNYGYGRDSGYNRGHNSNRGYTPRFGRNYGSSLSFR